MVAPGFLQSPNVIRWLGSIEPAWTLLMFESFNALRHEPSKEKRALVLASDLTDAEISLSPIARNMLLFLQRASVGEGLKLTGAGNLSRAVVAEMVDLFEWPEFDRAEAYRYHKVLNEPDFLPLYFVRHIATQAKLVRPYRGFLRPTQLGRDLLSDARRRACKRSFSTLPFGMPI